MRLKSFFLFSIAALVVAGCNPPTKEGAANEPTSTATAQNASGFKAAMVSDSGGIADKSFNASAWAGMQRAGKELGFEPKVIESRSARDFESNLRQLAEQGYNVVVAAGYLMGDAVKSVAPKYPNVKFAIVDGDVPGIPNAAALKFREEEGSFLVGYIAGATSKSGKVGFVGGMEGPLIKKFETGFKAGVKTANPNAEVLVGYVGDWNNIGKAKNLANTQFGQGADIIYHAAGKGGSGVILAAQERGEGFYAIGVDQDQDGDAPGRVLTSMVKRVDNAVYETIKAAKDGKFQAGTQVFGLKEKGVGPSEMKHTKDKVSAATLKNVETLTKMIEEGKLKPPSTDEELAKFTAPTLQ